MFVQVAGPAREGELQGLTRGWTEAGVLWSRSRTAGARVRKGNGLNAPGWILYVAGRGLAGTGGPGGRKVLKSMNAGWSGGKRYKDKGRDMGWR